MTAPVLVSVVDAPGHKEGDAGLRATGAGVGDGVKEKVVAVALPFVVIEIVFVVVFKGVIPDKEESVMLVMVVAVTFAKIDVPFILSAVTIDAPVRSVK